MTRINPHIAITPVNALLDDAELAAMIAKHDLVLDCTDNVAVRNLSLIHISNNALFGTADVFAIYSVSTESIIL